MSCGRDRTKVKQEARSSSLYCFILTDTSAGKTRLVLCTWTEIFRIFKWPDLVFNVVSFDYHIKCLPYVYVLNKTFHIIHLSTIILSIVAIWVYDFKIVVKFNKWLSVKCFWNLQVKKEILEREILEKEILHVERWIVFGENARSLKYEGCVIDFSHGL